MATVLVIFWKTSTNSFKLCLKTYAEMIHFLSQNISCPNPKHCQPCLKLTRFQFDYEALKWTKADCCFVQPWPSLDPTPHHRDQISVKFSPIFYISRCPDDQEENCICLAWSVTSKQNEKKHSLNSRKGIFQTKLIFFPHFSSIGPGIKSQKHQIVTIQPYKDLIPCLAWVILGHLGLESRCWNQLIKARQVMLQ